MGEASTETPVETGGGGGGIFFSDNFEQGLSADWKQIVNGGGTIGADATMGANGTGASVKVNGSNGFHTTIQYLLPETVRTANQFYGRAYMRVDAAPGSGHYVWIETGSAVDAQTFQGNDANEMRFGYNIGMLQINHYGGPPGGDQDIRDQNKKIMAATWHCVQFFMDGEPEEFRIWLDGEETALSTTNFTAQREGSEGNMTPLTDWMPPFDAIRFGWELGGATIWFDEIALGTEEIPCQ